MKRQGFHHSDNCACPACMAGDSGPAAGPVSHEIIITPGGGGIVARAPVHLTLDQIIEQLQTQWGATDDGFVYEGSKFAWAGHTIHYWIPTAAADAPDDDGHGARAGFNADMNRAMQVMATEAFEGWDALIGRSLVRVTDAARVHGELDDRVISFAHSGTTHHDGSYNQYERLGPAGPRYDYEIQQSAIWLSDGSAPESKWAPVFDADRPLAYGSYGYMTYLHEIGHALGLSHAGSYDAHEDDDITYSTHAEYVLDTRQYTIMSYFGGWNDRDRDGTWTFDVNENSVGALYPQTPMLHDVLAIQSKYGIDTATRSTNTIYGFGSTAGDAVFDFATNRTPILTIYDAGGYDTLDCSGFWHDQTINLEPGTYSSIGALVGNVAIAHNTSIDKAIGGWRNDTIYGNADDNWLEGGEGRDYLDGKAGGDTMVGGRGNDTYVIDNVRDVITEDPGGGLDEVFSFLPVYELRAMLENATVGLATGGTLRGTNGWDNVLTGNAGADTLDGRTGADIMRGMGGNDTYHVDNLGDRAEEARDAGSDMVYVTVSGYTLPTHVEHGAVNTTTGLTLNGNGEANHLYGNAGIDTLFGGANSDRLFGNGSNDTLDGGLGADRLTGGEGKDIFVLRRGEAHGDTIVDFEGFGAVSGDIIRLIGYGPGAYLTQSGTSCTVRSAEGIGLDTFSVLPPSSGLSSMLHVSDFYFV